MMPNDKAFQPPQLPPGFPLAGAPAIDPAVMNQVRTIAHSALDGVLQWAFSNIVPLLLQGLKQGPQALGAAASEAGSLPNMGVVPAGAANDLIAKDAGAAQQAAKSAIGPFPHGDVDLRFMGPNVAPDVRPNRAGATRRFYFLDENVAPPQVPQKAADGTEQPKRVVPPAGGGEIVGFKPG